MFCGCVMTIDPRALASPRGTAVQNREQCMQKTLVTGGNMGRIGAQSSGVERGTKVRNRKSEPKRKGASMKIIAYDRMKPGVTYEKIEPYLPQEVANVWRLWKAGIVRENYARADELGVVIVFELD